MSHSTVELRPARRSSIGCGGGCGSSESGNDATSTTATDTQTVASSGDPSSDKLAQVLARGTLILFTDPAYPPQSYAVKGAKRLTTTKCAANQLTGNQITGYDAETGKLVAKQLGIEPCFVTPSWTEVTGGNWGDRWDLAYGSGAVALDRMDVLYMTQPSTRPRPTSSCPRPRRRRSPRTCRASGSVPAPAARWRSISVARSRCPGRRSRQW